MTSIFSGTKYLEKGMDASWQRNSVIMNNIANVDTPNFKSSRVEFESLFKSALQGSGVRAKRTRDKHIDFGSGNINTTSAVTMQNDATTMRMDGNNVDIDYENAQLAKNQLFYYTLTQQLNAEFSMLRNAIEER